MNREGGIHLSFIECLENNDIRDAWLLIMHLIHLNKRMEIVKKMDILAIIKLNYKDPCEIWDLLNIRIEDQSDPYILFVSVYALHEGLDNVADYLFSLSLDQPQNMLLNWCEREFSLELAMRNGWTGRAWLRQNYLDMNAETLLMIWKYNPDELLDYFISSLSLKNAPRLMGLCKKLNNIDELQFIILRYLIDYPGEKRKVWYCIKYTLVFVDGPILQELYHECIQLSHIPTLLRFIC